MKKETALKALKALKKIEEEGDVRRETLVKEYGIYIVWRLDTRGFIRVDRVMGETYIRKGRRFENAMKRLEEWRAGK